MENLKRIKVSKEKAQAILDLLNSSLSASESIYSHNPDTKKIYIEIGGDIINKEFEEGYMELIKILKAPLKEFMIITY